MQQCAIRVMVLVSLHASALYSQQGGTAPGRTVTFALGPVLLAERDLSASLLRYTGTGVFLQGEYAASTELRRLTLRLGGSVGHLESRLTQSDGRPLQETASGWGEVEYARRAGDTSRRTRLYLGGRFAFRSTVVIHRYNAPAGNDGGYLFYRLSLGPTLAVERSIGRRSTLGAHLGVPLLALIGRPYGSAHGSPVPVLPSDLQVHLATVPTFLAGDFAVAYATAVPAWGAVVLSHHVAFEHYRGNQGFRVGSQGVSIAMTVRLKSTP